jgi:hypothetical protein
MNKYNTDALTEQLILLKSVTLRTGAIHEAQALQLKMWPKLMEGVASSEAKVDVENKKVVFNIKATEEFNSSKINKRIAKEIISWTRLILWDQTEVVFKVNRKILKLKE